MNSPYRLLLKEELRKFWLENLSGIREMQIDFVEYLELPPNCKKETDRYLGASIAILFKKRAKWTFGLSAFWICLKLKRIFEKYGIVHEFICDESYEELPLVPQMKCKQTLLYLEHMTFPVISSHSPQFAHTCLQEPYIKKDK